MTATLTIGKIAALTGVSPDTIRYYERLGLLPKPTRTPAGYRQYSDSAVKRLTLVRNAQRFGFSLRDIARFLHIRESGGKPCHDVRAAAQRMLNAVDRHIVELKAARKQMRETLRSWDDALARTPSDKPAYLLESLRRTGSQPPSRRLRDHGPRRGVKLFGL